MEFGLNRGVAEMGDKPGAKNKAEFAYSIFSRFCSEYCLLEESIMTPPMTSTEPLVRTQVDCQG
jgi:hypothetical protein